MRINLALKLFFYFLLVLVIEFVYAVIAFLIFGTLTSASFITTSKITSPNGKTYEMSDSKIILSVLIILAAPIAYNIIHGIRHYKKRDSGKVVGYILVSIILIFVCLH